MLKKRIDGPPYLKKEEAPGRTSGLGEKKVDFLLLGFVLRIDILLLVKLDVSDIGVYNHD